MRRSKMHHKTVNPLEKNWTVKKGITNPVPWNSLVRSGKTLKLASVLRKLTQSWY